MTEREIYAECKALGMTAAGAAGWEELGDV